MTEAIQRKSINDLKPDDMVKVCPHIQFGCCFQLDGIHACCLGTTISPVLVRLDEIKENKVTYDLIVERRKELFGAINKLNDKPCGFCNDCTFVKEVPFKDVSFEYIGGKPLPAGMNVQHYTACNERCEYCCYAQNNDFKPPQYDILKIYDLFKEKGKLRGNNWIDFSGGEPAALKDFEKILTYYDENNMGTVVVYTNATIFSQKIYDLLAQNKIILTTSVDTGLKSTYAKLRGLDAFDSVMENLMKYRNSGTSNLWLKYVVTERNRTEDDMWSFIMAMLAISPDRIMICPDFPYGDREIPVETVDFVAKLWHLLEKYTGMVPGDFTSEYGDPKFEKYHRDLAQKIEEWNKKDPICSCDIAYSYKRINVPLKKPTFLQQIFSIRNERTHKVLRLFGIKLKFKRNQRKI